MERDYELPDDASFSDRLDRFACPFQWIGRTDFRRDHSLPPQFEQRLDVSGIRLRVARGESSPEDAADVAALQQSQVERESRNAGRKADNEEPPLPGDAAKRRLGVIAADGIVYDVRASRTDSILEQLG